MFGFGDITAYGLVFDKCSLVIKNCPIAPALPADLAIRHNDTMVDGGDRVFPCQGQEVIPDKVLFRPGNVRFKFFPNDLVSELKKLRCRGSSFLKIKISSVIECLNHYIFPAFPCEYNEREIGKVSTDLFEKRDPVHPRHLIIRDNYIIPD